MAKLNTESVQHLSHIPSILSIGSCFFLSVIYVSSLYVWNTKYNRDHPLTVKKRFCSVFVVNLIAPIFLYKLSTPELLEKVSIWELLGFRLAGLLPALIVPLLLTVLLFLGPVCVELQNGEYKSYFNFEILTQCFNNMLWIRNHIVAPLSEEFVYRACMMPLIMQSFPSEVAVLITPLFFGTAHVHHVVERVSSGMKWSIAILLACFQMTYTTLFGIYSAFLFARTGHFIAPCLVHAFCNLMGLPDLQKLWYQPIRRRIVLIGCYISGLVGWMLLLPIATEPNLYKNTLFWNV